MKNAFAGFLLAPDKVRFWRDYPFDVSPVSDDRPFFFYTVQARDLLQFWEHHEDSADYKINRAVPLLFGLVAISIIATGVILALPPLLLKARLPVEKGLRTFLWYFVCLGAGYIMIQVALIQKFILLLGHPTYALTVIIFSMLISSGLGSYYSRRFLANAPPLRLTLVLVAIFAGVSALAFAGRAHWTIRRRTPAANQDRDHHRSDRPRRIPDGYAVPDRSHAVGIALPTSCAMGVGTECRLKRDGIGRRDLSGNLSRPANDAANRRRAVSRGAAGGSPGSKP